MPEEKRIISHIRLFIPKYNVISFEEVMKWVTGTYLRSCRPSAHRDVTDYSDNDFEEKIFKPMIDALKRMLPDDFVSKKGLTKKQIIKKTEKGKDAAARAYRENCGLAFKTVDGVYAKKIIDKIPLKATDHAREMTFGQWRFIGPIDGQGKGAAILAGLWLSGDPETLQSLREKDQLITGQPGLITEPKRAGQFRKQLQNLLLHLGEFISYAHFSDEEIKKANKRINKLLQEFAKDGLEVLMNLVVDPTSVTPADSKEVLEIKCDINKPFLGEKMAQDIRATSIEKDYRYPLNPDEYIGNPNKKAYFDMFLDIRVSRK